MSKDEVIEVLASALVDAERDLETTGGLKALEIIKRALAFLEWREQRCPTKSPKK